MSNLKFSREEYAARLHNVKSEMAKRGFDVLLATEPSNIYYLTGYDAWSFYTPQALVVSVDAEMPIWFGRLIDAASARRITYLSEECIQPYPDSFVQAADRHPFQLLAKLIQDNGWADKRIAVESDAYYYTARSHEVLARSLPNARLGDSELLVNWVRIVKSPREIGYMKEAGRVAERMMSRAVEMIAPGVRECDVIAAVYQAQIAGTPEFGGVYSTSPPHFGPDERASEPHAVWSDQPLRNGIPRSPD
jgi:ectoine hydrolase